MAMAAAMSQGVCCIPAASGFAGESFTGLPWGQRVCLRASTRPRRHFLEVSSKELAPISASSKRRWRVFCEVDRSTDLSNIVQTPDSLSGASSPSSEEIETSETSATESPSSSPQVQLDLNLPRRSLLVEFTCDVCKARTQRLINPKAHRSGTVFVQCSGCEAYHNLVDNLNLVQEFDFRNEVGPETKTDSDP